MKLIHFLLFFVFVLVIIGLLFGGTVFLISRAFVSVQQNLEFSPMEDNMAIADKGWCSDSDGGLFNSNKGVLSLKQRIMFFNFDIHLEDKCTGNNLVEYYCTDKKNVAGQSISQCPNACKNGACVI